MRRVVVTPTFAAGLGVVVAAVLAYPMQTVFSYVAPGTAGEGGMLCTQGGCAHQPGPGKPSPFGVGGGAVNPSSPGHQPKLSYKITSKWQGGFWGQITITFPQTVPGTWWLRIGYPSGHILGVNPSGHLAPNGHAALVRSADYAGGSGPGGRTFAVGVGVQGMPTHPGRCSFNGRACHFG